MIDIKDRVCEAVAGKIMSAEAAAEFVKDGDNVPVVLLRLVILKLCLLLWQKKAKKLLSKSTFGPVLL
jgi:hypothetical protein